jgi:hypothetical protein
VSDPQRQVVDPSVKGVVNVLKRLMRLFVLLHSLSNGLVLKFESKCQNFCAHIFDCCDSSSS